MLRDDLKALEDLTVELLIKFDFVNEIDWMLEFPSFCDRVVARLHALENGKQAAVR